MSRLSTGRAGGPWPEGRPGLDLKGCSPICNVAGLALFGRAKGQHMFEPALRPDPGQAQTDPQFQHHWTIFYIKI